MIPFEGWPSPTNDYGTGDCTLLGDGVGSGPGRFGRGYGFGQLEGGSAFGHLPFGNGTGDGRYGNHYIVFAVAPTVEER